ncbi:MAG: hypothetical protein CM15mP12_4100 [Gammaproteobacteria bacterium]|nr:MAG: hypothetical protein CM15mP12_4100 [Gammaproteobacteria bacterium]
MPEAGARGKDKEERCIRELVFQSLRLEKDPSQSEIYLVEGGLSWRAANKEEIDKNKNFPQKEI